MTPRHALFIGLAFGAGLAISAPAVIVLALHREEL